MAWSCFGVASPSRSTSACDKKRVGFCLSLESGTANAAFAVNRLSAMAAAKH